MYTCLNSLRNQRDTIEHLIRREERHPFPDTLHIRTLKKFKLRLRDEIRRIEYSLKRQQAAS